MYRYHFFSFNLRVVFVFLFVSKVLFAQYTCDCDTQDQKKVYKNRIVSCGVINNDNGRARTLQALVIKDCKTGDTLFVSSGEESYIVRDMKDSFVVRDVVYLLDSNVKDYVISPLWYVSFKITPKGKVLKSRRVTCINIPPLTQKQKDAIRTVCDKLENRIAHKDDSLDPDGFEIMDVLFLGTITGDERARNLYQNLRKYFVVDGAYGEDYDSFPVKFILEQMGKNK